MAENDRSFQKVLESEIQLLAEEEDVYEFHATPLKSAVVLKEQHLEQIRAFLKFEDLRLQFEKSQHLIMDMLPGMLSLEAFDLVKKEIANSGDHFALFMESMDGEKGERHMLLQEMFGFSDETLLHIYALARHLMDEDRQAEAYSLLIVLTTLAPYVASYWIAEGICLQSLDRHEEALAVFSGAKLLNDAHPAPFAYSIESSIALKENARAKEELKQLQNVLKRFQGADKDFWENTLRYFLIQGI